MMTEALFPAVNGDVDAVWPSEGCIGGPTCRVCPRWRCTACLMLRPFCMGVSDEHPGLCDFCWVARHRKWQVPCPCGAVEARP